MGCRTSNFLLNIVNISTVLPSKIAYGEVYASSLGWVVCF